MRVKRSLKSVLGLVVSVCIAVACWDSLFSSLNPHNSRSVSPALKFGGVRDADGEKFPVPSLLEAKSKKQGLIKSADFHKAKVRSINSKVIVPDRPEIEENFEPYTGQYYKDLCANTHEALVECSSSPLRPLTPLEVAGGNILFSVKTTQAYHDDRLRELLESWLNSYRYPENVYFVSDAEDEVLERKLATLGKELQWRVTIW